MAHQLRFLADESCDYSVVRALRNVGFDVVAICERAPGLTDEAVAALAHGEGRILLTEDRDFGRLVFAGSAKTDGVIYIRVPARQRKRLPLRVVEMVEAQRDALRSAFVVLTHDRVRLTRLP